MIYKLETETIELQQLLKVLNFVQTGGEAKIVIAEGLVKINGEVETKRRKKLRKNDVMEYKNQTVRIH